MELGINRFLNMNTKRKIQLVNILTVFAVLFSALIIFTSPAADAKDANERQIKKAEMICSGVFKDINSILNNSDGTGIYDNFVVSDTLPGTLGTIYDSFKVIAGLWVIVIAVSRMINNIDKGQDEMECVWKCLIEIGITGIFLTNLDEIVKLMGLAGKEIVSWAGTVAPGKDIKLAEDLIKAVSPDGEVTGDWVWRLGVNVELLFPYMLTFLIKIVAQFILYQIIIEVAVRRAFMPFAVADIYQDGLRSPGARYFKKYLACFIKLAMCIAIAALIGPLLASVGQADKDLFVIKAIVLNLTCVGFMFKTGELANDVMGV